SLSLLQHVTQLLAAQHYALGNTDITVVAQRPRLAPYVQHMAQTLATTVGVDPAQMSVKATTTDGLGFVGAGAGIAAYAVCLCRYCAPAGEAASQRSLHADGRQALC